jgi:hypothetical protein
MAISREHAALTVLVRWVDAPIRATCWRHRPDAPLLRRDETPAARSPGIEAPRSGAQRGDKEKSAGKPHIFEELDFLGALGKVGVSNQGRGDAPRSQNKPRQACEKPEKESAGRRPTQRRPQEPRLPQQTPNMRSATQAKKRLPRRAPELPLKSISLNGGSGGLFLALGEGGPSVCAAGCSAGVHRGEGRKFSDWVSGWIGGANLAGECVHWQGASFGDWQGASFGA